MQSLLFGPGIDKSCLLLRYAAGNGGKENVPVSKLCLDFPVASLPKYVS